MLYPSINKIRKKADSRYTIVILAAKRARDLIDGKPSLTEEGVDRPVSIAAREIADDLITYKRDESARDQAKDAGAEEPEAFLADEASAEETEEADAPEEEALSEETEEE